MLTDEDTDLFLQINLQSSFVQINLHHQDFKIQTHNIKEVVKDPSFIH